MYAIYKQYFLINLKDYPNIGLDFYITIFISCFALALIVTTIFVNYKRSKIELLMRQLTRHNAKSEESAKTLSELKLDTKVFRYLLSKENGQLGVMVSRVGETKPTYEEYMKSIKTKGYKEEKIDFALARFYIKESGKERAEKVLEMGAPSVLNTLLFCILIVALYVCLTFLMPGILTYINDILKK